MLNGNAFERVMKQAQTYGPRRRSCRSFGEFSATVAPAAAAREMVASPLPRAGASAWWCVARGSTLGPAASPQSPPPISKSYENANELTLRRSAAIFCSAGVRSSCRCVRGAPRGMERTTRRGGERAWARAMLIGTAWSLKKVMSRRNMMPCSCN